ncbi:MAG: hypothetical protein ACREBB_01325 [Nitrosotalea sp.]
MLADLLADFLPAVFLAGDLLFGADLLFEDVLLADDLFTAFLARFFIAIVNFYYFTGFSIVTLKKITLND